MSKQAYALRADFAENFTGATATYGEGRTFNIGEALEQGGGTIVTDDDSLILSLNHHPALKLVPAGDADVTEGAAKYDEPVAALRAELIRRGIAGGGRASKDTLAATLAQHDAHIEAGDLPAAASLSVGEDGLVVVDPNADQNPEA